MPAPGSDALERTVDLLSSAEEEEDAVPGVEAPTLLIVGERDEPVIEINESARERMKAEVRLEIVPGATHLFEEEGALDRVAALARYWFLDRLA